MLSPISEDNPLKKRFDKERGWCMCCVKCLGTFIIGSVLLIVVGCLLIFTSMNEWFGSDNKSGARRVGIIFLVIGILVVLTGLIALICLIRTVMRFERRINNPEPFVAPKTGYPKQQYE